MEAENGTFKKGKACCDSNTKTDDSSEEHERHLEKPKETGKDFCLESLLKNRRTKDWECFLPPNLKR